MDPPENSFQAFLAPGPKPLPERLIFITREYGFLKYAGIRACVFEALAVLGYGFLKRGGIRVRVFQAWVD